MRKGLTFVRLGPERIAEAHAIAVRGAEKVARDFGPGHWERASQLRTWTLHLARKSVFAAGDGGRLVAVFKLEPTKPRFVSKKNFSEPGVPFLWSTDFYVDPEFQGRGIGRACLDRMRRVAATTGFGWIRFDAYDAPAGAGAFYEKCGCVLIDRAAIRGVNLLIFELRAKVR